MAANTFKMSLISGRKKKTGKVDAEKLAVELREKIQLSAAANYREIEVLTSMAGISVFTAAAVIADVGEVSRFPNAKKFYSYLRSAPGVDNSNETVKVLSTNKHGCKLWVRLLCQSLNHFRDANPKFRKWYDKLSEHKAKGKVRMGLCPPNLCGTVLHVEE